MNPLSLQLWTLNDDTAKDFAGTVAAVAKIGYGAVELAGTGNLTPEEGAKAIRAAELQVSGMHVGWPIITEKFDELVGHARLFETKEIVLPWIEKEHFATRESCLALGEKLGAIGAKLRGLGLNFTYHNHDQEFALLDGRPALEWLLSVSSPRDVGAEVDLYWVQAAGLDPLKAVSRLGARARLLHLKDGMGRKQADLGKGRVDFPAILKFVRENELTDWFVVEQEEFSGSRLDAVQNAFNYLKSLGLN